MSISLHLQHMPDEIVAQPGIEGGDGQFTPVGATIPVTCRISDKVRRIILSGGNEVTATLLVTLGAAPEFDTEGFRYVLPSRYHPNGGETGSEGLKAKSWKSVSGRASEAQHHEVLRF